MADISLREEHSGQTVEVGVGERLAIDLKENPTTGYKWSVPAFDQQQMQLEVNELRLSGNAGVGGGGARHFEWVAKSPGKTTIEVVKRRPWEESASSASKFNITVVVNQ